MARRIAGIRSKKVGSLKNIKISPPNLKLYHIFELSVHQSGPACQSPDGIGAAGRLKSDSADGLRGANGNAGITVGALLLDDFGEVVFYHDGFKGAGLYTYFTNDASNPTDLAYLGSFIVGIAVNKHLGASGDHLDDIPGTDTYTLLAAGTLFWINPGQSRFCKVNGVKWAGYFTIAKA
jgi:hypothetical protein